MNTNEEQDQEQIQEPEPDPTVDKFGEALNATRFRMLEDIARELAGDVVFPTYFAVSYTHLTLPTSDLV